MATSTSTQDYDLQSELEELSEENPYPGYQDSWSMGEDLLGIFSRSIVGTWAEWLGEHGHDAYEELDEVVEDYTTFMSTVYDRDVDRSDAIDFMRAAYDDEVDIDSSQFDAISFAFYHNIFDVFPGRKREFAEEVGRRFYSQLEDELGLDLPEERHTEEQLESAKENINVIGEFLGQQGYLGADEEPFEFKFEVEAERDGENVCQGEEEFITNLDENGRAYAQYVMSLPGILPSAVYLFNIEGEAQHHSSRIFQELFDQMDLDAAETDDFDPTGHDSEKVVEFWIIEDREQ